MSSRFNVREWLNLEGHHGNAYITATVPEVPEDRQLDGYWLPYISGGSIDIADCNRRISLSFDIGDDDGATENSLYKLDLLLSTLQEFREHLLDRVNLSRELEPLREAIDAVSDGERERILAQAKQVLARYRIPPSERPKPRKRRG